MGKQILALLLLVTVGACAGAAVDEDDAIAEIATPSTSGSCYWDCYDARVDCRANCFEHIGDPVVRQQCVMWCWWQFDMCKRGCGPDPY